MKDAIGFANTNYGGSGVFKRMEAFMNQKGSVKNSAYEFLGDRVILDSIKIVKDTINHYLVVQKTDDSMCCPTKKVKWQYIFSITNF